MIRHLLSWSLLAALLSSPTCVLADVVLSPPGLAPGSPYRLVFVTSTTRDATSSNIADYNSFVTGVANHASSPLLVLGTTWTAIASTQTVSAITNTSTPTSTPGIPIYRVDGVSVATSYADLWDDSILNPIEITEHGALLTATPWTGTSGSGAVITSKALGVSGSSARGNTTLTDSSWIADVSASVGNTHSLYAISGTLTAVPEPSAFLCICVVGFGLVSWKKLSTNVLS